jgi:hypothetical protein
MVHGLQGDTVSILCSMYTVQTEHGEEFIVGENIQVREYRDYTV